MGKQVGTYLQELRQRRRLTLRQLSTRVELSPGHLSLIERGLRKVSIQTLYPLVEALDGDFSTALYLLAKDAGVPERMMSPKLSQFISRT